MSEDGRMRVLVIGASGQLGQALTAAFSGVHHVLATACTNAAPGQVKLDLGDPASTSAVLADWRPEVILLAGAMCHVDRCELEPDLCHRINVAGPSVVANYARERGARLVFFSTDHVFPGRQSAYAEDDQVQPLSVYARSKADAEAAIRRLAPEHHVIVRTGWVYGPDPQRRNFVLRLIQRLRAAETVDVPADQFGSPTYTADLAGAVRVLVERQASGTFHATGPEFLDRVELATRVCSQFGLDRRLIVPRPTSALGQPAQRSLRVRLDCGKLQAMGVPPFRDVGAGLDSLASWLAPAASVQEVL